MFCLALAVLQAIEQAAVLYDDYCRVITPENLLTDESEEVCAMLLECMELRRKWLFWPRLGPEQRRVSSSWTDVQACVTSSRVCTIFSAACC